MNVIKRDGSVEPFKFEKIETAVGKAFKSCEMDTPFKFIEQLKEDFTKIVEKCEANEDCIGMDIEEIQDEILKMLIKKNKFEVVESFVRYRDKRTRAREMNTKWMKKVKEKLECSNVENQNANVDEYSFGGRTGEAARVVTKEFALNYCMSKMSRDNHNRNEIYIHDLDSYVIGEHNCLTCPIDDLLKNGFSVRQTDIRPANSVNTAFQLVAVIFQVQSLQQFGL